MSEEPIPIEDILDGRTINYHFSSLSNKPEAKSFRCGLDLATIQSILTWRIKQLVPELSEIDKVIIHGKYGKEDVRIELSIYSQIRYYESYTPPRDKKNIYAEPRFSRGFTAEEKDYRNATEHTKITTGSHGEMKVIREWLEKLYLEKLWRDAK